MKPFCKITRAPSNPPKWLAQSIAVSIVVVLSTGFTTCMTTDKAKETSLDETLKSAHTQIDSMSLVEGEGSVDLRQRAAQTELGVEQGILPVSEVQVLELGQSYSTQIHDGVPVSAREYQLVFKIGDDRSISWRILIPSEAKSASGEVVLDQNPSELNDSLFVNYVTTEAFAKKGLTVYRRVGDFSSEAQTEQSLEKLQLRIVLSGNDRIKMILKSGQGLVAKYSGKLKTTAYSKEKLPASQ